MQRSRDAMMKESGGQNFAFLAFNLAEVAARRGRDGLRWDGEGWYGGDIDRIVMRTEGDAVVGAGVDKAEVQLLYSRAIDPYFNVQAGVRQDLGPGPKRSYASIGVEGLAPYWFDVEGTVFLSTRAELLARIEAYYDQRITQRLILQPRIEANFSAQEIAETGTGAGLTEIELGLRLRYEFVREFAPYVGVEWAARGAASARFARAAGEPVTSTSAVAGIRFWF